MRPSVSIVIPARNDAEALERTLGHLTGELPSAAEIIVAAAGPRAEVEQAVKGRARLIWPEGTTRARMMNAGAARSRGDVLFFLHADSFPPTDALAQIAWALADPRAVGGAFEHVFAERVWSLRVITCINRIRYRLTRNYYGDQGIFGRADVFRAVGGYPDQALLEDLVLSRRLRRLGRYVLVRTPLVGVGSALSRPRPVAHVLLHRLAPPATHAWPRYAALRRALARAGASGPRQPLALHVLSEPWGITWMRR